MPTHRIICLECAKIPAGEYPGEWIKRVRGVALHNFRCDQCNATIPGGTRCVAESFGKNRTPYIPWEHEFIKKELP